VESYHASQSSIVRGSVGSRSLAKSDRIAGLDDDGESEGGDKDGIGKPTNGSRGGTISRRGERLLLWRSQYPKMFRAKEFI
jgi:hypothetical protein